MASTKRLSPRPLGRRSGERSRHTPRGGRCAPPRDRGTGPSGAPWGAAHCGRRRRFGGANAVGSAPVDKGSVVGTRAGKRAAKTARCSRPARAQWRGRWGVGAGPTRMDARAGCVCSAVAHAGRTAALLVVLAPSVGIG